VGVRETVFWFSAGGVGEVVYRFWAFKQVLGPSQPSITWALGALSVCTKWKMWKADRYFALVPRLQMPGAVAPFPACTPDMNKDKLTFISTFALFKQRVTIWNENIWSRRGAGGSLLHAAVRRATLWIKKHLIGIFFRKFDSVLCSSLD
jgi:hypothetical protein